MIPYEIIMAGDKILQQIAEPVSEDEFGKPELIKFSELMLEIKRDLDGSGLAAPQIGISKRIIVLGLSERAQKIRNAVIADQLIINPNFHPISDVMEEDYEGCFSVGNLAAKVPRYKEIAYEGYDAHGNYFEGIAAGLHARIIQHEVDHLNGILFLEKVIDKKSFMTYDTLRKIRAAASKI